MSVKTLALGAGIVVLAGLAGQSSLLAVKLWGLNQALQQNLHATHALIRVQQQMVTKNKTLGQMLTLTRGINGSLSALNTRASAIQGDVTQLQQINRMTNREEGTIVTTSHNAGASSLTVNAHVTALTRSTAVLLGTLDTLKSLSQEEVSTMRQVLRNASTIEAKTP